MPSARALQRQARQLALLHGGEDLVVGSPDALPLPLATLRTLTADAPAVRAHFAGGLTAEVFRITVDGRDYTVKRARQACLVHNADGETSFLNEVQRRRDFEALKQQDRAGYAGIVDTLYASLRDGLIVSPWIDGEEILRYTPEVFDSVFFTLMQMARGGVFECDPTHGNLLWVPGAGVRFFDFGYAYPFDPRCDINSDGLDLPVFHAAERFETRCFMLHLLDLEELLGRERALALYREEKTAALQHYMAHRDWLAAEGGSAEVLAHVEHWIGLWRDGLSGDDALWRLYRLESFRSCLLDVHDDLSGRSCTPDTLLKAGKVIEAVESGYDFIHAHNGFFWGDERLGRDALLAQYRGFLAEAARTQQADLSGFEAWRTRRRARMAELYA